jgi:hypothetical protein
MPGEIGLLGWPAITLEQNARGIWAVGLARDYIGAECPGKLGCWVGPWAKKKRVAFNGDPLIEDYTETTNVINLNVSMG